MLDQGLKGAPKLIERTNWFAELFNNNNFSKLLSSLSKSELRGYTVEKVLYCQEAFDLRKPIRTRSTQCFILFLIETLRAH
jgi:hypothetical protein